MKKRTRNILITPLVLACWPITLACYVVAWVSRKTERIAVWVGDQMPRWRP